MKKKLSLHDRARIRSEFELREKKRSASRASRSRSKANFRAARSRALSNYRDSRAIRSGFANDFYGIVALILFVALAFSFLPFVFVDNYGSRQVRYVTDSDGNPVSYVLFDFTNFDSFEKFFHDSFHALRIITSPIVWIYNTIFGSEYLLIPYYDVGSSAVSSSNRGYVIIYGRVLTVEKNYAIVYSNSLSPSYTNILREESAHNNIIRLYTNTDYDLFEIDYQSLTRSYNITELISLGNYFVDHGVLSESESR